MVDDRRKKDEIVLQIQYRLTEELLTRKLAEEALRSSEEKIPQAFREFT